MFTDRLACIFEQADLAPLTASKFYKVRRKVAAILKSVNRHLRIRALFGTSEIAVKIQIVCNRQQNWSKYDEFQAI